MQKQTADYLIKAADHIGVEAKLYENYAARGLRGETTTGIVIQSDTTYQLVAFAASLVKEEDDRQLNSDYIEEEETEDNYSFESFLEDCANFKTDGMGKTDIILY